MYSEFVFVAIGIQHTMPAHPIVICGLLALQYFLTLSHKWHDTRKRSYWT